MLSEITQQVLPPSPAAFSGNMHYGLYSGAVADVTTAAWQPLRRAQRKTWVFGGVYTGKYYAGLAIADAGVVATAFVYFFDVEKNVYLEEKITVPYGMPRTFDPGMNSEWRLKNFSITSQRNALLLDYRGKKLSVHIELENNVGNGLTTIAPSAGRPFNHTYKNLQMPSLVNVSVNGENISYGGNIGFIDFSKGYPPRNTFWNWALMSGETDSGISVGLNLVAEYNNSIENALWFGDTRHALPQAIFEYKQPLDKNTWSIRTLDGTINLKFTPAGKRAENINALIMYSKFVQCFGKFEGTVTINGTTHNVTGYGVVEEHFAKW